MQWIYVLSSMSLIVIPFVLSSQKTQTECGKTVGPGKAAYAWPWHVAVFHRSHVSVKIVCSGTLISRSHVLTAAHCAINRNTKMQQPVKNMFVQIGGHEVNLLKLNSKQLRGIKEIHMKENYTSDSHFGGIAVLDLDSEVMLSEFVQLACVYLDQDLEDKVGTVLGWGLADEQEDDMSLISKEAQSPVVNATFCQTRKNRGVLGSTLDHGMFCAGRLNGTGICNGDSGSGFMIEIQGAWHVAGIVSYTASKGGNATLCQTSEFAVYTRIYDHLSWLSTVTKQDYPIHEEVTTETVTTNYCESKAANGTKIDASKFPANCGEYTPERIQHGHEPAAEFEFPWMAVMIYKTGMYRICAGTLISNRYILTQADCVRYDKPTHVRLGEHSLNQTTDCYPNGDCAPPDYSVQCVIEHPEYRAYPEYNDIALVRTKREVVFQDHIRPICLPVTTRLRQLVLSQYVVTEWEVDKDWRKTDVLKKALVIAADRERCQNRALRMDKYRPLTDANVCIADRTSPNTTSTGDFGGPLGYTVQFNGMRFVQFGVLSESGYGMDPAIYTNVSVHMEWIAANMGP